MLRSPAQRHGQRHDTVSRAATHSVAEPPTPEPNMTAAAPDRSTATTPATRPFTVAIVGATGAVGQEFLDLLAERQFPIGQMKMFASERSAKAGKTVHFAGKDYRVEAMSETAFDGIDIAFFSAGGSISKQWGPVAAKAGALVIDNSSAFRLDDDVPLVVPEINGDAARAALQARGGRGIIANPNCTTIVSLMAVAPIHRAAGVTRMIASSYQAVSGTGARALEELDAQASALAAGKPIDPPSAYPVQIAFNVLPLVGDRDADGNTSEELKLLNESRKIMSAPDVRVSCTCVRVPVRRCHAVSITLGLSKPFTPDDARAALKDAPGVTLCDLGGDPANDRGFPLPLDWERKDNVGVGRLRDTNVFEGIDAAGLSLWVVGDQLRKGAALNAIQIAEYVIADLAG